MYRESDNIELDIFYKPTDSHNYVQVPFNSGHPRPILRNIPYSLFNRINRIVSKDDVKETSILEMKEQF